MNNERLSYPEKKANELLNTIDIRQSLRDLEREAEDGHPELYFLLGCTYQTGEAGNCIDHQLAHEYYKKGYIRGNEPVSGYELARIHFYGFGDHPVDYSKAYSIASKLAYEHNFYRAYFMLAYLIENGLGTDPDTAKAMKYYRDAYMNGCIPALGHLGRLQQYNGQFFIGFFNRIKAFFVGFPYILFKRDDTRISYI